MTTTINADTSTGGAVISGDASGVLGLQAAGSTQVTINGSGVVLANPLPVGSGGTGATSLSGITAGSATNLAGGSAGTVPYQSASGTTAMLAAGTSGQVLQSNGASAPSWATPATGAMTLLATVNATSGTYVTFDGYFTSAYDVYLIVGSNFLVDNTYIAGYLRAQLAVGSSFQTSGYRYNLFSSQSNQTSMFVYSSSNTTQINLHLLSDYYRGTGLTFYIYNPLSTNGYKTVSWTTTGGDSSNNVISNNVGAASYISSSSALSGVRFFWSGGDFQAGKFQLYGLKNS